MTRGGVGGTGWGGRGGPVFFGTCATDGYTHLGGGGVLNAGAIDTSGGGGFSTLGAGDVSLFGAEWIENDGDILAQGALDVSGGNGGSTSGYGGRGGFVVLTSLAGSTTNSGTVTVSGGTGGTAAGSAGAVTVDGVIP